MYYLVSRDDLLEMLEAQYRLAALETGGVDNWEWCSDSFSDFLKEYIRENKNYLLTFFQINEDELENMDFGFDDIARVELTKYDLMPF